MYCPKCRSPLTIKLECRCGWKSHEAELPRPPVICDNCQKRPSVLNKVVVKTLSGTECRDFYHRFGRYERTRRGKTKLFLKPGFMFVRWETVCERCQAPNSSRGQGGANTAPG